MHFDPAALTLRFADRAELDRFHREVTSLLRHAIVGAARPGEDPAAAAERARDAMAAHAAVTEALNAIRGSLPRDP